MHVIVQLDTSMMDFQKIVNCVHIDVHLVQKKPVNVTNVKILDQISQNVTVHKVIMMTEPQIQYVKNVHINVLNVLIPLTTVPLVLPTE